jgi:transposase InsO family protein
LLEVHPALSKGHRFLLVATDYFTKWTEAVPLKNMMYREVINFVQEHIVHQFRIPQMLTTDQGASFMSQQFKDFTDFLKIKLLNSSPYYTQANGLAESSNKTLIKLIKKKIVIIQEGGMKHCQKHFRHIELQGMEPQR